MASPLSSCTNLQHKVGGNVAGNGELCKVRLGAALKVYHKFRNREYHVLHGIAWRIGTVNASRQDCRKGVECQVQEQGSCAKMNHSSDLIDYHYALLAISHSFIEPVH
jgi:hypothetical protein